MSPTPTSPAAAATVPAPSAAGRGLAGRGLTVLVGAAAAAGIAGVLVWTAPRGLLLVVLVPVQLLLALGWLTLAAVPARLAGAAIAAAAGIGADVLLTAERHPDPGGLAGVIGLGVVAAVLGQLVRRERSRVTDVLAAQCSAVLLAVAVSPSVALAARSRGDRTAAVGLLAIALCLLAGGLGARVLPAHPQEARAGVGLVLGGVAAAGVGAIVVGGPGAAAAAVAAVATVVAELVVDVVAGGRRVARPVGALLPFALAAPCVYVVGAVMLR